MNTNKIHEHRWAMTAFALIAVALIGLAGIGGAVQTAKADATHAFIRTVNFTQGWDSGTGTGADNLGTITSNGGSITVAQGTTISQIMVAAGVYKSFIPTLTSSNSLNFRADVTITPPSGSPTTIQVYNVLYYTNNAEANYNSVVLMSDQLAYTLSQTGSYTVNIQLSAYY